MQIFFQILVHCMIWCDDGLPKNSRAKLYSTTVSQTQFFSPFFFFFILHSIHFWNREYLCVFGGVRKTRVFFFGGKFNSDTLLPTTHWALKKIPRNAIFFFITKKEKKNDVKYELNSISMAHMQSKKTLRMRVIVCLFHFSQILKLQ